MNDPRSRLLPDELRARLDREGSGERQNLERVWTLLGEHNPYSDAEKESEAAWAELEQRLDDVPGDGTGRAPRADRQARPGPRRVRRRGAWIAAVAALAVLLATALVWMTPAEVSTAPGERAVHTLPDGSVVELTGGTTLTYARRFQVLPFWPSAHRTVSMEGEAYFEVVPGERPFLVETFNARIEVTGTEFDVQAWPDALSAETQVTLASGAVHVVAKGVPGERVSLSERGQRSRIVGHHTAPSMVEQLTVDRAAVWRQHGFLAEDQPIALILQRLEMRFGVSLTLRNADIQDDALTIYYTREADLETILRDISMTKGLTYRPTSQGYELVREANDASGR